MKPDEQTSSSTFQWRIVIVPLALALVATAFVIVPYVHVFSLGLSNSHERWAQFGDYLGGVLNPLFGFLSLLVLLFALVLQSRELSLSTRELRNSADALAHQHKALLQQNFENTLFQLLRRFNELVSEVRYQQWSGREALQELYQQQLLAGIYKQPHRHAPGRKSINAYEIFYESRRYLLGHYFRTLYHIFKFIDTSDLSDGQKVQYSNIVRAQLSSLELALLFYNGTCGEGKIGFKPLIERYGLLKHVNPTDLLDTNDYKDEQLYRATAFLGYAERASYLNPLASTIAPPPTTAGT